MNRYQLKYAEQFLNNLDIDLDDIQVTIQYSIDICYKNNIICKIEDDNGICLTYNFFHTKEVDEDIAIEMFKQEMVIIDCGTPLEFIKKTDNIMEYQYNNQKIFKIGGNFIFNSEIVKLEDLKNLL
jgi:hypothetical protein